MSLLRRFIESQQRLSSAFDRLLPADYSIDGNTDFLKSFAPQYLCIGQFAIDVGSGKHPYLRPAQKRDLKIHVTGLDISQDELDSAPPGTYDQSICADITKYVGNNDVDLVICQALLEHVPDVRAAFQSMASMLKPGGKAVLFVPSRNAVFARLNLILPEEVKRKILFAIFPAARQGQGFKSYYNRCTPDDFRQITGDVGLQVIAFRAYYVSSYFSFFFPLYFAWRIWVILFRWLLGDQAAETFCIALEKPTGC